MSEQNSGIKIVVMMGSVRPGNYTAKAAALVADELAKDPHVTVQVIDPATMSLPLPGTDVGSPVTEQLRDDVSEATGIVLATPEYRQLQQRDQAGDREPRLLCLGK